MPEGSYGKEPFDLRLTVLRIIRQWKKIGLITLAGTLLAGGIYCAGHVLPQLGKLYGVKSVYRIDYNAEDKDAGLVALNAYTWNTYMHTEEFLGLVRARLAGSDWEELGDEELGGCIQGDMESDWRVPFTTVITDDREKSAALAKAVEEAVSLDFAEGISEIRSIRVIDHGGEAKEIIPDLRTGRALILGAVVTFFFALVILLIKETGDDNIWLPSTLWRRYGVKPLGTRESRELKENICYLFKDMKRVALCTVQEECNPAETADALRKACEGTDEEGLEWLPLPSPLLCPEAVRELRAADGILLAVKAGAHGGKQTEYTLDFLAQQDCKVTAVILLDADETLLRWYYGFHSRADGVAE